MSTFRNVYQSTEHQFLALDVYSHKRGEVQVWFNVNGSVGSYVNMNPETAEKLATALMEMAKVARGEEVTA